MSDDPHATFKAILEESTETAERYTRVAETARSEIRAATGIEMTDAQLMSIARLRLSALCNDGDPSWVDVIAEAARMHSKESVAKLEARTTMEKAQQGDAESLQFISGLSRIQRMEMARSMPNSLPGRLGAKDGGSIAAEDNSGMREIFSQLSNMRPADRIAAARKLGLTK